MLPVNRQKIAAQYKQALSLLAAGHLGKARKGFLEIAQVAPELAEVHFQLGRIAAREGDFAEADRRLSEAQRLKPSEAAIRFELAKVLEQAGQVKRALSEYDALIGQFPKETRYRADKALLLQQSGDFEAAEREFRKALKNAPYDGELYRIFLGGKKLKKGDPLFAEMKKAWRHPRLSKKGRVHLGFALAKAMEDTGQTNRVFTYLNAANSEQRSMNPYDPAARDFEVNALLASMDSTTFDPVAGAPGFAPIIVTGMPRSGTTLVERILASHSTVGAGGEMGHALRLAFSLLQKGQSFRPMADLTTDQLIGFARDYEIAARRMVPGVEKITDKAIQNFLIVGMIHKALPNARFIIVRRDPRDVALSIYKNLFKDGTHRYSTNLEDIAHYIKGFERAIGFWKARLPDQIHEVQYEDLVADPETQSRALVQAAGLEWERCLPGFSCLGRKREDTEPASGPATDLQILGRRLEEIRNRIGTFHQGVGEAGCR